MFVLGPLLIAAAPVVIEAPVEAPLLDRIRGQTSDLPWSVEVVPPLKPRPDTPLARARAVAAAHGARVVMWFEPRAGGGVALHIAQASEGRLLTRTLGPAEAGEGDPTLARSALFETVALAVRSSLRALIAGGQIGVAVPEPAVASPPPAPPPPPPPPSGLQPRLTYTAHLGWQTAFDGQSPYQQGIAAGAGIRGGPWFGGLSVATSLGTSLTDARTTVALTRHTAALTGGRTLWGDAGLRLAAALSAGAALYRRSTTVPSSGALAAEPRTSGAFVAGAELRLDWLPAGLDRHLGLRVSAGGDALVGAPRLQYRQGDRLVPRGSVWAIQPRVALSLLFSSGE